jgi:hypothetical protein
MLPLSYQRPIIRQSHDRLNGCAKRQKYSYYPGPSSGSWILAPDLVVALHALPVVPVSMTPHAGTGVETSIDLVLDDVITSVGQFPVRPVAALQGRLQFIAGCMALQAK